jgi:hypothetical protein
LVSHSLPTPIDYGLSAFSAVGLPSQPFHLLKQFCLCDDPLSLLQIYQSLLLIGIVDEEFFKSYGFFGVN